MRTAQLRAPASDSFTAPTRGRGSPDDRASSRATSAVLSDPAFAAVREVPDDAELTRRLVSLISLLGIYAIGLVLVAFVSDGPDIGVLLAALFGHACFVGIRYALRAHRHRNAVVSAGSRGVVVFARKARYIRYRDITGARATDAGLTLRVVRSNGTVPEAPGHIVLRWAGSQSERDAFLAGVEKRLRRVRVAASTPSIPVAAPERAASAARESLARVAAALSEFAPKSSTHIPVPG